MLQSSRQATCLDCLLHAQITKVQHKIHLRCPEIDSQISKGHSPLCGLEGTGKTHAVVREACSNLNNEASQTTDHLLLSPYL